MKTLSRPNHLFVHRLALALIAVPMLLAAQAASAQWQWVDSAGNKVFSDTPPPPGVPEKSIVKRPGARTPAPATAPAADDAPSTTPAAPAAVAAPKLSGTDPQLEAKKKQAEAEELARKKAELDKQLKSRADTCERAKRSKATIASGVRLATTNAKGEREILDDKAKAVETARIEEMIRTNCGPLPPAPAQ